MLSGENQTRRLEGLGPWFQDRQPTLGLSTWGSAESPEIPINKLRTGLDSRGGGMATSSTAVRADTGHGL